MGVYNGNTKIGGVNHTQGEASFPIKIDTYTTSQSDNISVSLIESKFVDFNYELAPARQPFVDNGASLYDSENITPIQTYSGFSPNEIVEIEDVQTHKNNSIYWVKISPIQYDHSNKIVRAYTKIKYKVEFTSKSRAHDIVITPHPVEQDTISQDYVIISTNKYATAVNNFVKWKRQLGFNTIVALNDNWTPTSIKNKIREVYERNSDYCYALIIGDHDDVPSNISTTRPYNNVNSEHITDLYYGCFNGNDDYFPEVAIGRIAVSSLDEANIVVDKIINYEKNPPINSSFYNSGMVCATFIDSTLNTIEDVPVVQTTENIRNRLIAKGKCIDRMYHAESYYNPQYYYNGNSLPSELKKPTFVWDNNDTDIINALENGRLFALHYGHGNTYGWAGPHFVKGKFLYLNNNNLQPVVFSFNCLTGEFNRDCFAEFFLKKENGGCVGIFAATSQTYLYYDSFTISSIFSNIWPQSDLGTPEYRIGDILNNSKYVMSTNSNASPDIRKYQSEIYHCFGDPSMMIRTESPSTISNVFVTRNAEVEGAVRVTISGTTNEKQYIAFHDARFNKTLLVKGTSALYRTNAPEYVTICVYNHNKIPYLNLGQDFEPDFPPITTSEQFNSITNINSTPTNGSISFEYTLTENAKSVNIIICDLYGNIKSNILCSKEDNMISTDISHLNKGIYVATFVVDGITCDSKRIVVQN